jgi:hypothetical protein
VKKPNLLVALGLFLAMAGLLGFVALPSLGQESEDPPPALVGPAMPAPTLVVWGVTTASDEFVASLRKVPGVRAVAQVWEGTGWMSAWANTGTKDASGPLPGLLVPVDVASVKPNEYKDFLPERDRTHFLELANRGAVLSRSGAALRGIEKTGSLQFEKIPVPVVGVVDDDLLRGHELMVSIDTGGALATLRSRYLVVAMDPKASKETVQARIRKLAPAGAPMGIRQTGTTQDPRPSDSVLSLVQIKTLFGEFSGRPSQGRDIWIDHDWVMANTEIVNLPLVGEARCHKAVIPELSAAMSEIAAKGLGNLIKAGDFGGCFSPRFVNAARNSGISHHSWGIAIDFNVTSNLYGQPPTLDPRIVEIMERWGFTWGGRWLVPDGMHFEFVRHAAADAGKSAQPAPQGEARSRKAQAAKKG